MPWQVVVSMIVALPLSAIVLATVWWADKDSRTTEMAEADPA